MLSLARVYLQCSLTPLCFTSRSLFRTFYLLLLFHEKGERRFYLGAVVDDMFLKTAEFEYGEGIGDDGEVLHEGTVRSIRGQLLEGEWFVVVWLLCA